jgi:hypothetical protein
MNPAFRLVVALIITAFGWIAVPAMADVPIDCDPAKNCKPIDPCELAPERCKPDTQPRPTPPPSPKEQEDPCKYCVCPAPTVLSCRKCCG